MVIFMKATLHKGSLKGKGYIIFIEVKSNTKEVSIKVYGLARGNLQFQICLFMKGIFRMIMFKVMGV